jgi:hypothetical protein
MYALLPAGLKTIEFGDPVKVIAVPAVLVEIVIGIKEVFGDPSGLSGPVTYTAVAVEPVTVPTTELL